MPGGACLENFDDGRATDRLRVTTDDWLPSETGRFDGYPLTQYGDARIITPQLKRCRMLFAQEMPDIALGWLRGDDRRIRWPLL